MSRRFAPSGSWTLASNRRFCSNDAPVEVDLTIVGAGPGGYVAAIRAGQLGLKTVLLERDEGTFGGTCLHRGCIPTKILLHAAALWRRLPELRKYGIRAEAKLDWPALLAFRDRIVQRLNSGTLSLLKKARTTIVHGFGRLQNGTTVEVNGRTIRSRAVILATGSEARPLPGMDIDDQVILTNVEALRLPKLPASLLVIGAGAVGIEFAALFAAFGTKVTVVEMLPRILPVEDEEISRELEKILRRRGVEIRTSTHVESVRARRGKAEVAFPDGATTFEKVLVAVGRKPNTDGIGLERTRAKVDRGFVEVDGFQQTAEPGLYAIGDITPAPQLAHVASMQGIVAVEHAAGHPTQPIRRERIPSVVFSDPEVASVGLTEAEARNRGHDVVCGRFSFQASGKALVLDEPEGFVKIVSERKYGEVLGVHILHTHAAELIGEGVAALAGELTVDDLARAMHPHPTLPEAIAEAAHAALGHALHM